LLPSDLLCNLNALADMATTLLKRAFSPLPGNSGLATSNLNEDTAEAMMIVKSDIFIFIERRNAKVKSRMEFVDDEEVAYVEKVVDQTKVTNECD
jgi:hypothetical protein